MKMDCKFVNGVTCYSLRPLFLIAFVFLLGVLAGVAQTNIYLFSGSETNITLGPGIYDITAYGAQGGGNTLFGGSGGLGAEMQGRFYFSRPTTITLLVGSSGGSSFVGGGGGSIIDSSAMLTLAKSAGVASPHGSPNGEIIVAVAPEPTKAGAPFQSVEIWCVS